MNPDKSGQGSKYIVLDIEEGKTEKIKQDQGESKIPLANISNRESVEQGVTKEKTSSMG